MTTLKQLGNTADQILKKYGYSEKTWPTEALKDWKQYQELRMETLGIYIVTGMTKLEQQLADKYPLMNLRRRENLSRLAYWCCNGVNTSFNDTFGLIANTEYSPDFYNPLQPYGGLFTSFNSEAELEEYLTNISTTDDGQLIWSIDRGWQDVEGDYQTSLAFTLLMHSHPYSEKPLS